VAVGLGGAIGSGVGIGVNNLVQTGLNKLLGTPTQSLDPRSGKIQNVGAGVIGTGAYTVLDPSRNAVSVVDNGNGTLSIATKDGGSSVVNKSTNGIISQALGSLGFGGGANFLGISGSNRDSSVLEPLPGLAQWTTADGSPVVDRWNNPVLSAYPISAPTDLTNLPVVDNFGAYDMGAPGSDYDATFLSSYDNINNWDFQ